MKRILLSLIVVGLAGSSAAGATMAYYSDTTAITGSTYTSGNLDINVNGEASVIGAQFTGMAPGEVGHSPEYTINNHGGTGYLAAHYLRVHVANANDFGSGLWQHLMVKVENNRWGWPTWHTAYTGLLKDMGTADILYPPEPDLIPGGHVGFKYHVWLPGDGNQNMFMGDSLTWDFVIEARTN